MQKYSTWKSNQITHCWISAPKIPTNFFNPIESETVTRDEKRWCRIKTYVITQEIIVIILFTPNTQYENSLSNMNCLSNLLHCSKFVFLIPLFLIDCSIFPSFRSKTWKEKICFLSSSAQNSFHLYVLRCQVYCLFFFLFCRFSVQMSHLSSTFHFLQLPFLNCRFQQLN